MKLPKSSHTGDPLTIALISYPGKDTHQPKIPGNPSGTYNMPKLYSRSTNDEETSKRGPNCVVRTVEVLEPPFPCSSQDRVVQTFVFSSRPSCIKNVVLVQLLPLSSRTLRQPTVPSRFPCRPSSTTTQHSLCFYPSTTTPCRPIRKTIIV